MCGPDHKARGGDLVCTALLFFGVIGAIFGRSTSASATALGVPSAAALIAEAAQKHLADTPKWRKLLFYVPRWLPADNSVVSDASFFLAPTGRWEAQAELAATLTALLAPLAAGQVVDEHPYCRYPARLAFLRANLPDLAAALPNWRCRVQERWLATYDVNAVSLIFASYFVNNPASLFGHTFLRLHRRSLSQGKKAPPALLDFVVNFAANPYTYNPLLYSYLGLSGGFPGTFSLMPYYLKIQEYNNFESRDLWEYHLGFSPEETQELMAVLWEVGPHFINYYYIDENCSFIMLLLLDAVRPELNLGNEARLLVTPADTVRSVVATPGFVTEVSYRASSRSRLIAGDRELTADERSLLQHLTHAYLAPLPWRDALYQLSPDRRTRVIDVGLDWIEFKEGLSGSKQAEVYQVLQEFLLAERAKLPAKTGADPTPPVATRPDFGPPSQMSAFGLGRDAKGRHFLAADWRPTLHNLESPSLGYSASLQIELLHVGMRALLPEKTASYPSLRLQSLRLFDALSLPAAHPLLSSLAWHFSIGSERVGPDADVYRRYLGGGIGRAYTLGNLTVYTLATLTLGSLQAPSAAFIEPGVSAGAYWPLRQDLMLSTLVEAHRTMAEGPLPWASPVATDSGGYLGKDVGPRLHNDGVLRIQGTYAWRTDFEGQLYGAGWDGRWETGFKAGYFF